MHYHTMKMQKIKRKTDKIGKKAVPAVLRACILRKKQPSGKKTGNSGQKWPLFSEMQLLFSKNVVSFAMTFFLFNKKALNNERK